MTNDTIAPAIRPGEKEDTLETYTFVHEIYPDGGNGRSIRATPPRSRHSGAIHVR